MSKIVARSSKAKYSNLMHTIQCDIFMSQASNLNYCTTHLNIPSIDDSDGSIATAGKWTRMERIGVFCCCGLFRNPFIRPAAFLDKIGCDGGGLPASLPLFSATQLTMDVPWHLSINQQNISTKSMRGRGKQRRNESPFQ